MGHRMGGNLASMVTAMSGKGSHRVAQAWKKKAKVQTSNDVSSNLLYGGVSEQWLESKAEDLRNRMSGTSSSLDYCVSEAAMYMQDAFDGVHRAHALNSDVARMAYYMHVRIQTLLSYVLLLWTLLTFFEKPMWCVDHRQVKDDHGDMKDACETSFYPTFGLPYATPWVSFGVQLPCLIIYVMDIALQIVGKGKAYFQSTRNWAACALAVFAVVDLMVFHFVETHSRFRELVPYIRLGMLMNFSTSIRQESRLVIFMLPELLGIGVLVTLYILLYGWIGMVLFKGSIGGHLYFNTFSNSLLQLFYLITTANFPDVMMPSYNENRVTCLFYISFLLLGLFFLLNVVLAIVFNKYTEAGDRYEKHLEVTRNQNLKLAFACLDNAPGEDTDPGEIQVPTVMAVLKELQTFKVGSVSHLTEESMRIMINALDDTGNSLIDENEFLEVCSFLQIRIRRVDEATGLEALCPAWFSGNSLWASVQAAVNSHYFDYAINALLVANIAVLLWQTEYDLSTDMKVSNRARDTVYTIEAVIVILFALEILIKLAVHGWENFISSTANQLALVITLLLVAVIVYLDTPVALDQSRAILYIACFRLLIIVPMFEQVLATFFAMMPAAHRLFSFMACLLFLFAAVGMQMFGGMINTDPDSVYSHRLVNSSYPIGDGGYYPNNFNDMGSGIVVLFELLCVNNWNVIADSFATTSQNGASRVFFIVFYILGVVICLNIVVAFVLDTFMKEYEQARKAKEEKTDSSILATASGTGITSITTHKSKRDGMTSGRWSLSMAPPATAGEMAQREDALEALLGQDADEESPII